MGKLNDIFIEQLENSRGIPSTQIRNLDINSLFALHPSLGGDDGMTAQGLSNTTNNIITSRPTVINLSTLYYPTVAQKIYFASTSIEDNPTGTGAATILIRGLDTNYEDQYEVITLNGQTPVPTVYNYIRLIRLTVLTFGSGNVRVNLDRYSAGVIYAGGSSSFTLGEPTLPMMCIDGSNSDPFLRDIASKESIFTVKEGYFWLINKFTVNSDSAKVILVTLNARLFGEDFFRHSSPLTSSGGETIIDTQTYIPFPPKTDIQMRVYMTVSSSVTACSIEGKLFDVGGI